MEKEKIFSNSNIKFSEYISIMCLSKRYNMARIFSKDMLKAIEKEEDITIIDKSIYSIFIRGCLELEALVCEPDVEYKNIVKEREALSVLGENISKQMSCTMRQKFIYSQDIYNIINDFIVECMIENSIRDIVKPNFHRRTFLKYNSDELDYIIKAYDLTKLEKYIALTIYNNNMVNVIGKAIDKEMYILNLLEEVSSIEELKKIEKFIHLLFITYYSFGGEHPIIKRLMELGFKIK